eukprot:1159792-Pelagomonas_calceolata.AAC.9
MEALSIVAPVGLVGFAVSYQYMLPACKGKCRFHTISSLQAWWALSVPLGVTLEWLIVHACQSILRACVTDAHMDTIHTYTRIHKDRLSPIAL